MDLVKLGILQRDSEAKPDRKKVLLFTNCTGRALTEYLLSNPEFRSRFNLDFIETAPLVMAEHSGMNVLDSETMQHLLHSADVFIGHNLGPRHGRKALAAMVCDMNDSVEIITFVAPNCSALWPIAYGYGGDVGVFNMLSKGANRHDIWKALKDGSFDPLFAIRWRFEMGRLSHMEASHHIGIADFINRNVRKVKLFNAGSHPTGHVVRHIGCCIMDRLGCAHETEEQNLASDGKKYSLRGQPETRYEFDHYKFQYPMTCSDGFNEYYGPLLDQCIAYCKSGGWIRIQDD